MKIRMSLLFTLLAVITLPVIATSPALAQDKTGITNAFLNQRVWLKVKLPGTQLGIDIYPQLQNPFPNNYNQLISEYPLAYNIGDSATVTKIDFKKDHIEFQFDHGGWGQFGDNTDTSAVTYTPTPQSSDEVALRQKIATVDANDVTARVVDDQLLQVLVNQRAAADAQLKANAVAATNAKIKYVQNARVHGGSRLNITYQGKIPINLSVNDVQLAVAPFVSFTAPPPPGATPNVYGQPASQPLPAPQPTPAPAAPAAAPAGPTTLQNGMTPDQVHKLLGAYASTSDQSTDLGTTTTELYLLGNQAITVTYLNGVVIKSLMAPR